MQLRHRLAPSLLDLGLLLEISVTLTVTWFVLGWPLLERTISQQDGPLLVAPLTRSALAAGSDWTDHLYRFGVLGGSKMHEFAGTMPIVQLSALLGLSTSIAVNLITLFVQLTYAFFGIKIIEAMQGPPIGARSPLSLPVRIAATWCCGFAPVLGWRLGVGHENLLIGLIPYVATVSLFWCARGGRLSGAMLAFAAFAVFNGVSGLGAQTVTYGAVFGLPIVLGVVLDGPPGKRWRGAQWAVTMALLAGVLIALPRLVPMLVHAFGDDASRGLDESVTYSYGAPVWRDWVESLPWTPELAARSGPESTLHERNYPIGPLLCFLVLLWQRRQNRLLGWALVTSLALAIVFALDIRPVSRGLLAVIPPLEAFRVPARASLPVVVILPSLLLGAVLAALPISSAEAESRRGRLLLWGAIAVALAVMQLRGAFDTFAPEALAWSGCLGVVVIIMRRSFAAWREHLVAIVIVICALGVVAFEARFPRGIPIDRVEDGPAELRAAVLAQAPEIANPLYRVQVVDADPPFGMSMAFAAGLPSLDGVWYPPRRFLQLLSVLSGHQLPPTAAVFSLSGSPAFPVLQQLYNVRYFVSLRQGGIGELPETLGAAWFPRRHEVMDDPRTFARAVAAHKEGLRDALGSTAWIIDRDLPTRDVINDCEEGRVERVDVDALGQQLTIRVVAPMTCLLVVSTNYVSTLRATALRAGAASPAVVFPVDIALTGVLVPGGTSTILLRPEVPIAPWTLVAAALGYGLIVISVLFAGWAGPGRMRGVE